MYTFLCFSQSGTYTSLCTRELRYISLFGNLVSNPYHMLVEGMGGSWLGVYCLDQTKQSSEVS